MCEQTEVKPTILCPRCGDETQEPDVWRPEWRKMRMKVLVRDKFKCQYPGCKCRNLALLTIHHIKPRSEGGKSRSKNLITMCQYHHALTHDTLPKEEKKAYELSRVYIVVGVEREAPTAIGD